MSETSQERSMAEDIIECLYNKGIRLLALDFDKTIVSVHTKGMWKGGTPQLAEHVRPCFKDLIEAALDNKASEMNICIVTYSKQPVLIRDVLKMVLPRSDISRIIIRANSKDWVVSPGPPFLGKQQHIAWITTELYKNKHLMIEPHEILLIDDDEDNIKMARDFGHMAFEVPDNDDTEEFTLDTLRDYAQQLVVDKREPVLLS